jgi:hypothetical protein
MYCIGRTASLTDPVAHLGHAGGAAASDGVVAADDVARDLGGQLIAAVQGFCALGLEHGHAGVRLRALGGEHLLEACELALVRSERAADLRDRGGELVALDLALLDAAAVGLELTLDGLDLAGVLGLGGLLLGARHGVVRLAQ